MDDNLLDFIESDGYLHFQKDVEITTKDFYDIYLEWCEDNLEKPRVMSSFRNNNDIKSTLKAVDQIWSAAFFVQFFRRK